MNKKFFDSLENHQIHIQHGFALPVILKSSTNIFLTYPVKGVLYIFEQGVDLSILQGVFHHQKADGSLGPPVTADRPVFEYNGG